MPWCIHWKSVDGVDDMPPRTQTLSCIKAGPPHGNIGRRPLLRWCPMLGQSDARPPDSWLRSGSNVANHKYRLGDCINMIMDYGDPCQRVPGQQEPSIGERYQAQAAGKVNLTVLFAITMRHKCSTIPQANDLVVHLRLGDVMEESRQSVAEMLIASGSPSRERSPQHERKYSAETLNLWWRSFRGSIKSVAEILWNAEAVRLRKTGGRVHLVGGGWHPDYLGQRAPKSYLYAQCMKDALEDAGLKVSMHTNISADDAFCFMARASNFVMAPGGFSTAIGEMVRRGGGRATRSTFSNVSYP